MQIELFPDEHRALSRNHPILSKSVIFALAPFLDSEGVMRIGGRIRKSPVPFSVRHPILLKSHPLVYLIINQVHLRALHGAAHVEYNATGVLDNSCLECSEIRHIPVCCVYLRTSSGPNSNNG